MFITLVIVMLTAACSSESVIARKKGLKLRKKEFLVKGMAVQASGAERLCREQ